MTCFKKKTTDEDEYSEVDSAEGYTEKPKMKCWAKSLIITAIVIFTLFLLAFLAIFVVFPIVVMESLPVERFLMFMNIDNPKNPDFENPQKYGITGVNNFYIVTTDSDRGGLVKIGVWQILPESKQNNTSTDYKKLLEEENDYPILLYLHGVTCNRICPLSGYKILRKHFHVISIDYRSFGDSSSTPLSEDGVINDNVQVYEWIRNRTKQNIFIWGHSLGAALSAHTVRKLKTDKNLVPTGLILESAFSTMREEILNNPMGKFFSWLAYFNATVLDPLENHGFQFWSVKNVLYVDCPIMIMHSEDDDVIPWKLGEKLKNVAVQQRATTQGNVTWHLFPNLGYKHVGIINDPNIPKYIEKFKTECQGFQTLVRSRKEDY